tara:strand:- start:43 stop:1074 length:1032 start_codon:yes stop_codon:yes gene_type:complete
MKVGNFLFHQSNSTLTDNQTIDECLEIAVLSEKMDFHSVWLGEHHFDGTVAYTDPLIFAASIISVTKNINIGFGALQGSFYHPVKLAEQLSLLDNLSKGRLIVGIGRGSAFNYFEYRGFGVNPNDSQQRLLELESNLPGLWNGDVKKFSGQIWNFEIPEIRPKAFSKNGPALIRACASLNSIKEMAESGRSIMLVSHTLENTKNYLNEYKNTMKQNNFNTKYISAAMDNSWIWRNIVVADSDEDAELITRKSFVNMQNHISASRNNLNTQDENNSIKQALDDPRNTLEHAVIYGSSETVKNKIFELKDLGIGGIIANFRLGDMSFVDHKKSLEYFAKDILPFV